MKTNVNKLLCLKKKNQERLVGEKTSTHWLQGVWGLSKDLIDALPMPSSPFKGKIRRLF